MGNARASGWSLSRSTTQGAVKGMNHGFLKLGSVYRFSSSCFCSEIRFEGVKTLEAALSLVSATVHAAGEVDRESNGSGGDFWGIQKEVDLTG